MSNVRFVNSTADAPAASSYATRISEDDWARHELIIKAMKAEDYTRRQILDELERRGLRVSGGQLQKRFEKWGLVQRPTSGHWSFSTMSLDDAHRDRIDSADEMDGHSARFRDVSPETELSGAFAGVGMDYHEPISQGANPRLSMSNDLPPSWSPLRSKPSLAVNNDNSSTMYSRNTTPSKPDNSEYAPNDQETSAEGMLRRSNLERLQDFWVPIKIVYTDSHVQTEKEKEQRQLQLWRTFCPSLTSSKSSDYKHFKNATREYYEARSQSDRHSNTCSDAASVTPSIRTIPTDDSNALLPSLFEEEARLRTQY